MAAAGRTEFQSTNIIPIMIVTTYQPTPVFLPRYPNLLLLTSSMIVGFAHCYSCTRALTVIIRDTLLP